MFAYLSEIKKACQEFEWGSPRTINSIKTAIACLIGYLIVEISDVPQSPWVLVTIVVVMSAQITVGSTIIKSYMRFWGTFFGAAAAAIIFLVTRNNVWLVGFTLFWTNLLFSYIAGSSKDISTAGTLGGVTVAMILLANTPTLQTAGIRFIEINLGILISLLVTKFVFPIRASDILRSNFITTFSSLADYYKERMFYKFSGEYHELSDLEEKVISALSTQRKLLHELETEVGRNKKKLIIYQNIIADEVKIFRCINLMNYSFHNSPYTENLITNLEEYPPFFQAVYDFLASVSSQFKTNSSEKINTPVLESTFKALNQKVEKLLSEHPFEQISAVNSFTFTAQILIKTLCALVETISSR
ncbi:MAG: FUSC family protein [Gammaproteobacteria bacterium]